MGTITKEKIIQLNTGADENGIINLKGGCGFVVERARTDVDLLISGVKECDFFDIIKFESEYTNLNTQIGLVNGILKILPATTSRTLVLTVFTLFGARPSPAPITSINIDLVFDTWSASILQKSHQQTVTTSTSASSCSVLIPPGSAFLKFTIGAVGIITALKQQKICGQIF